MYKNIYKRYIIPLRRYILTVVYEILFRLLKAGQLDPFLKRQYQKALSEPNEVKRSLRFNELSILRNRIHPPGARHFAEIRIDDCTTVMVNLSDKVGGDLFYGLGFEDHEFAIVRQLVSDSDVFVDVGANIGLYTLLASRLVGPHGSVHAFEPLEDAFDLLKRNVRLNKMDNVRLNPAALGESAGEAELYVNQESTLTSLGQTGRGNVLSVKKVPVLTLDEYAAKAGLDTIDFLKIDVEGFEGHVLRGGRAVLERSASLVILCELAEKNYIPLNLSATAVLEWMLAHHYAAWAIEKTGGRLVPLESIRKECNSQNYVFVHSGSDKESAIRKLSL